MLSKLVNVKQKIIRRSTFGAALGWIAAWAWAIFAGGGGLWLLWTKGPWPLTNGWFAVLSGVSACPATGWLLKKHAGVTVSGDVRIAAAALFFVAGKIALAIGI
ncbi:MAG: hypothetical protein WCB94_16185 [Terriglobales bacterium]